MKRTLTIVALMGAVALAGCISNNPHANHTEEGVVSGAVIGGALGALTHTRGNGALPNAAIGAVAGAIIGGTMGAEADRREAYWRSHFRRGPVMVRRDHDRIILTMASDVLFESGSAELDRRGVGSIRRVAAMLRHHPREHVTVYGFTDTVGSEEANMALSEARAEAVAEALNEFGVRDRRIDTKGFGEGRLRVQTGDGVDEPRNRRVEIVLDPPSS